MTCYSLDGVKTNFILEEGFDVIRKPFTFISRVKKYMEYSKPEKGKHNLSIPGQLSII